MYVSHASLDVTSGSAALRVTGRVNFTAEDATYRDPMFSVIAVIGRVALTV